MPPTLGRATPPTTPGHGSPREGETGPPKTRDMPLQVSQKEETGMTALHLMVMERTVVMGRTVVMERTVVMGRAVGVRMAQKAMTMVATIKTGTITGTMEMKNPNTVV